MKPGLEVAKYRLHFITQDKNLKPETPPWHSGFSIRNDKTEGTQTSVFCHDFSFNLHNQPISGGTERLKPVASNEIWELWRDQEGQFIFVNPMQALLRKVVINPDFTQGDLFGDFSVGGEALAYPLPQDLEIVFFANWLGKFGDLILHASGIAVDGKGYAFVGPSGVGKSTLAGRLSQRAGVTVLGEDQLILRRMGNCFWLFGTPWHENSSMRAPIGVPLEKIFLLDKKDEDTLSEATPMQGVTRLLQTAFIPYYRAELIQTFLERLDTLAAEVPIYHFSYLPGNEILNRVIA